MRSASGAGGCGMRNELAGCAGGRMGFNARRFSEVKSLDVGVVESNSGNALSIGIFYNRVFRAVYPRLDTDHGVGCGCQMILTTSAEDLIFRFSASVFPRAVTADSLSRKIPDPWFRRKILSSTVVVE